MANSNHWLLNKTDKKNQSLLVKLQKREYQVTNYFANLENWVAYIIGLLTLGIKL